MKNDSTTKARLWFFMKICAVQGILALTLCGVALAHTSNAQILDREVNIEVRDMPLSEALTMVAANSNVRLVYSADHFDLARRVSLTAEPRTLRDVLDELFAPAVVKYKVHEREAIITIKVVRLHSGDTPAQHPEETDPIIITGKVTDLRNQPMAGVNIIVKGTTTGTTTDADGNFTLSVDNDPLLVFSFIGYKSQEVSLGGRSVINIVLEEDIKGLDEVVVNAGYWDVKDRELTGNIGQVKSKDIEKSSVSNPIAAIQGRLTGVEIVQQTGVPGGNFKVRIRGTNSIANGNEPLYIIDGVPFMSNSQSFVSTSGDILGNPHPNAGLGASPLNSLNPSDIESIEILKDADATSIYGSRGANGVVLITTKKGKAGKAKVDFSYYSGLSSVARKANLLTTDPYIELRKEAYANDNITPTAPLAPDLLVWDTTRYTDWQEELIGGRAGTNDAQLSLSGGDKATQFLIGTGYHGESTVFPGDNSDRRISTHTHITNLAFADRLQTSLSAIFSTNKSNLLGADLTDQALKLPPNAPPLYKEDGTLSWTNWNSSRENPLAYLDRKYEAFTYNLVGNLTTSYKILSNLDVRISAGYTLNSTSATRLVPVSSLDPAIRPLLQNTANFSNSTFKNWIAEPQLNWSPTWNRTRLNLLAGGSFLSQTTEGLAQIGQGFASEALMKNIAAATTRVTSTNYYSEYRYMAAFGRVNYSFDEKYFLNLTGRRDGSSRFGPGKQFANFGALGAAWIFSREGFFSSIPFVSFGKLRASYGTTGNDQLGDYQYLDSYTISGSGPYYGGNGLTPSRLSNPLFGWETNRKLEVGLEYGMFRDRIVGSVSFYRNRSSDQLIGYPLAATAGFTSIQGNFPATVQNTGVEIELSTRNIETPHFQWSSTINLTVPRNKLIEFPDLELFPAYANTYVVGEPLSIMKLYNYTGLDKTTGLYTFEDVNQDSRYDILDRQVIKFLGQRLYGGLGNQLRYRQVTLDFLFQFVQQSGFDRPIGIPGSASTNQDAEAIYRWQSPSDNTTVSKATTTEIALASLYSQSSATVTNTASFIRLRNASLSWSMGPEVLRKLKISNSTLFIQGQNLILFTKYRGLDPETWNSASLPPLRTITAGLRLTL
jgi:TonB-linked SusC/RagA family outer membrane protein